MAVLNYAQRILTATMIEQYFAILFEISECLSANKKDVLSSIVRLEEVIAASMQKPLSLIL